MPYDVITRSDGKRSDSQSPYVSTISGRPIAADELGSARWSQNDAPQIGYTDELPAGGTRQTLAACRLAPASVYQNAVNTTGRAWSHDDAARFLAALAAVE